jgi:hypothetical protein
MSSEHYGSELYPQNLQKPASASHRASRISHWGGIRLSPYCRLPERHTTIGAMISSRSLASLGPGQTKLRRDFESFIKAKPTSQQRPYSIEPYPPTTLRTRRFGTNQYVFQARETPFSNAHLVVSSSKGLHLFVVDPQGLPAEFARPVSRNRKSTSCRLSSFYTYL